MNKEEVKNRANALKAYIKAQEDGVDVGLKLLSDKDDPFSISKTLSLLIKAERFQEAANLVRTKKPHSKWCDIAVYALTRNGEIKEALQVIDAIRDEISETKLKRCLIWFADAAVALVTTKYRFQRPILPSDLSDLDKNLLSQALTSIEETIGKSKHIESELEKLAAEIALRCCAYTNSKENTEKYLTLLLQVQPIPLSVVRLLASGVLSTGRDSLKLEELPDRIRQEHPESIEANLMASVIESEFLNKSDEAFLCAEKLLAKVTTEEERLMLSTALISLAKEKYLENALQGIIKLLGEKHDLTLKAKAACLVTTNNLKEAKEIIERIEIKDGLWFQLKSRLENKLGNKKVAAELMLKAYEAIRHPMVLNEAARLKFETQEIGQSAKLIETYIESNPDDTDAHSTLAAIYVRLNEFQKAANEYQILSSLQTEKASRHQLDRAHALHLAGEFTESLAVLDYLIRNNKLLLEAILEKSEILKTIGKTEDAFEVIAKYREEFWGEPRFVHTYMTNAYASNKDELAHEAFNQLHKFQQRGVIPKESIQPKSIDDFKAFIEESKKGVELINDHILMGRAPWILADQLSGNRLIFGWKVRTQKLKWCSEDKNFRASFSIYATNGFVIQNDNKDRPVLNTLQCNEGNSPIVLDLSSLITLYQLGLLDLTGEYFGKLILPTSYLPFLVEEAKGLTPHQASQIKSISAIEEAVRLKRINPLSSKPDDEEVFHVSIKKEESSQGEKELTVRDLIEILHIDGRINDNLCAKLISTYSDSPSDNLPHIQSSLSIGFETLRVIKDETMFEVLVNSFNVYLPDQDMRKVEKGDWSVTTQAQSKKSTLELISLIKGKPYFEQKSLSNNPFKDKKEDLLEDVSLDACALALENDQPLFADDRVCQTLFMNQQGDKKSIPTFGTPQLVLKLRDKKTEKCDSAFLELLELRYRFLVPTPDLLYSLVRKYKHHPPGLELKKIAIYIHECMNDPGLLTGKEPTDPPTPMAYRFFRELTDTIVEFTLLLWKDGNLENELCKSVTSWAFTHMLPSFPTLIESNGAKIANILPKIVLGHALFKSILLEKRERANLALRTIAEALGMEDADYAKLITQIMDSAKDD